MQKKWKLLTKLNNYSDHIPFRLTVEVLHPEKKSPLETIRSFGNSNFDEMCRMITKSSNPVCNAKSNQMSEELYQSFEDLIDINLNRKTRHRPSLPPWITASTSNLMKRLQIQQQLLATKPTSYRKRHVETLRVVVIEDAETCRLLYQEDLMRTRDTQMVFK